MSRESFLRQLEELFPSDRLHRESAQLTAFQSDGLTAFSVRPIPSWSPWKNANDRCVRLCHRYEIPFGLEVWHKSLGGSLPNADGIVIAMNRMNRILEVDPIDRIAIVEPGAINTAVTKAVENLVCTLLRSFESTSMYRRREHGF